MARLTSDEWLSAPHDNIVTDPNALTIRDLDIEPVTVRDVAVKYIRHYRRPRYINEM